MSYTPEFLERALKRMATEAADEQHSLMWRLFFLLRPKNSDDITSATQKLADLLGLIERHPDYAEGLRNHLLSLLNQKQTSELLMSANILPTHSFAGELSRRIRYKLLPPLPQTDSLRDWLDNALQGDDRNWISGVDTSLWQRVLLALKLDAQPAAISALNSNFRAAINGLSHRIAAAGLEPELLALQPELSHHASPFLALHEEIARHVLDPETAPDIAHAQVLIAQCQAVLARVVRNTAHHGTSIELTHLRVRLEQQLARLDLLLRIFNASGLTKIDLIINLFIIISCSTRERYSVKHLLRNTTQQLAYQITQHAGHTGEHYVAEDRAALVSMFRSAAGAGVIIAAMALLKIIIAKSQFLPFQEAALVSLNYAFGFILIYTLGLTIATKQPAMTASWMAQTLRGQPVQSFAGVYQPGFSQPAHSYSG